MLLLANNKDLASGLHTISDCLRPFVKPLVKGLANIASHGLYLCYPYWSLIDLALVR